MTKKKRRLHNPEQIVKKLRDADAMLGAGKEPGSPWENAFAESFNSRFREVLTPLRSWPARHWPRFNSRMPTS
jgi:hypothetical protein